MLSSHKFCRYRYYFFWQLTEEILLADHVTATCYSPQARKRGRKHRTEPSQYNYSKRDSWTSTENSLEIRRHVGYSVNNSVHSSKEIINLADVRAPLEGNDKPRPPLLHLSTQSISSLSAQAREMAGGQPDYVWESHKVRHPKKTTWRTVSEVTPRRAETRWDASDPSEKVASYLICADKETCCKDNISSIIMRILTSRGNSYLCCSFQGVFDTSYSLLSSQKVTWSRKNIKKKLRYCDAYIRQRDFSLSSAVIFCQQVKSRRAS